MRTTERLRLEPITSDHAGDLWTVHQDPAVAHWYGQWTLDMARREASLYGAAWASGSVHKWLAYERISGKVVGRGGLSWKHVDGERRLETGWALRGDFWGRGYASEIGRESLAYGFTLPAADQIVAFTEKENIRSQAVMARIGMHHLRDIVHRGSPFVLYAIDRPVII
ncbi:GNAT family N-acetyltransferase [Fodinicola feengrottensis]|uniref:GNAT family N-acetyltransferase n=1 Tax=Fodinicola feengrottensis TaxID=435914 RepID=UPI0031E21045